MRASPYFASVIDSTGGREEGAGIKRGGGGGSQPEKQFSERIPPPYRKCRGEGFAAS